MSTKSTDRKGKDYSLPRSKPVHEGENGYGEEMGLIISGGSLSDNEIRKNARKALNVRLRRWHKLTSILLLIQLQVTESGACRSLKAVLCVHDAGLQHIEVMRPGRTVFFPSSTLSGLTQTRF